VLTLALMVAPLGVSEGGGSVCSACVSTSGWVWVGCSGGGGWVAWDWDAAVCRASDVLANEVCVLASVSVSWELEKPEHATETRKIKSIIKPATFQSGFVLLIFSPQYYGL